MNYRLLIALILVSTAFSSHAQERWFEVELLLFQRNLDMQTVKEDLAVKNISIDSSSSIPLLNTAVHESCALGASCAQTQVPVLIDEQHFAAQANGFVLLNHDQLQLTEQRQKLQRHAAFKPLLHLAWRMPVAGRSSARPIRLIGGENYADNSLQGAAEKWAIDGNFTLYLDRYLFIDSQLLIRQQGTRLVSDSQQPEFEVIDSGNDVQVIKANENLFAAPLVNKQEVINEALFAQTRRLRSGEIHYFDHPLMGMIVQVRKIPQ